MAIHIDSHMLGGWPLGELLYTFVLLSTKEIDFYMTSNVGHWVANLWVASQWNDGADYCPLAMSPTLGTGI